MSVSQSAVKNVLLRALTEADFAAVAGALDLVQLKQRQTIVTEQRRIQDVYFPESGICSKAAVRPDRELIEVALVGVEGMTDMVSTEDDVAPLRIIVQAAGEAWKISTQALIGASQNSPSFLRLLLKYQQALATQIAFTALSHGSYNVTGRLARWLLMCQDRIGDDIPMVHEFLAIMLAVRRAGVTETIHHIEDRGAIRSSRGMIHVLDRGKLIDLAEGSYGVPEAEFERLIGPFGRPQPP